MNYTVASQLKIELIVPVLSFTAILHSRRTHVNYIVVALLEISKNLETRVILNLNP